jgi:hypothetical protein
LRASRKRRTDQSIEGERRRISNPSIPKKSRKDKDVLKAKALHEKRGELFIEMGFITEVHYKSLKNRKNRISKSAKPFIPGGIRQGPHLLGAQ